MELDSGSGSLRIMVFPWLAFGHMHPFLELSKSLAERAHHVSFISTPRNIHRLLPQIPSNLSHLVTFVPLALPRVEPLLGNAESTTDISQEHVPYLEKALDGLTAPFSEFLSSACSEKNTRPDWIIMDIHTYWIQKVAAGFGVPCAFFSVLSASSLVFAVPPPSEIDGGSRTTPEHFTVPPNWIPFRSNLAFRLHEAQWVARAQMKNVSGVGPRHRLISAVKESKFVCVRTCFELESKWLSLLSKLHKKVVIPVGLLPPPTQDIDLEPEIIDWLNKYPSNSVLYIAFGSEAALSMELLHELALGLEMSRVPFLWALRKPVGTTGGTAEMIPAGFQERVKEFGRVAMGWVPQRRILAHASIGGFLTHCGPSSVIESLQFGHPLIMLPLIADQGLVARELTERGVGVELPRDAETGSFDREGVAKVVRFVMVDEEGKQIRHNAKQIQPIYTEKASHEKHMDALIEHLRKFKQEI